ncbi:hypothetical protein SDC9_185875 [bioreactor metagenome]|uniref:Uncharacterized protein n=1 Tax=bioreactor metagenome TaxID=1076179 RepID=A0A645HH49_9ZZZZ
MGIRQRTEWDDSVEAIEELGPEKFLGRIDENGIACFKAILNAEAEPGM